MLWCREIVLMVLMCVGANPVVVWGAERSQWCVIDLPYQVHHSVMFHFWQRLQLDVRAQLRLEFGIRQTFVLHVRGGKRSLRGHQAISWSITGGSLRLAEEI